MTPDFFFFFFKQCFISLARFELPSCLWLHIPWIFCGSKLVFNHNLKVLHPPVLLMLFLRSEQMEQTVHFILQMLLGKPKYCEINVWKNRENYSHGYWNLAWRSFKSQCSDRFPHDLLPDYLCLQNAASVICRYLDAWPFYDETTALGRGFSSFGSLFFPPSLWQLCCLHVKLKRKKKAITQHITMPWSRWETMPHTCTVSNSFGLAFFKSISHYFCWRNPLEHPCGHWRNSSKNLLASKQLLFGFLFSSVFLASLPLELKNGSRGEVQIPAVHFSTNGCVQMAWREEAFDWGTKRHLWTTKSNSRKCTDTQKRIHTHSCAPYCSPSLGR